MGTYLSLQNKNVHFSAVFGDICVTIPLKSYDKENWLLMAGFQ